MEQCIICGTQLRENETVCPQCGFVTGLSFLSEKQYESWLREAVEPYRREYGQKCDRLLAEQQQKYQQECEKKLPEEATPVKRKKKWLIPIAGVLATVAVVGGIIWQVNQSEIVESGTYRDNIKWTLDEKGTLTFSGYGSINAELVDTIDVMEDVQKIVIENGISEIGGYAFWQECINVERLTFPNDLQRIGRYAFSGCSNLKDIVFEGDIPDIGNNSFVDVTATVHYPSSWKTVPASDAYGGNLTWVPMG